MSEEATPREQAERELDKAAVGPAEAANAFATLELAASIDRLTEAYTAANPPTAQIGGEPVVTRCTCLVPAQINPSCPVHGEAALEEADETPDA